MLGSETLVMEHTRHRLQALSDERIPEMQPMLGSDIEEMLTAVTAVAGGSVQSARPSGITWRPGRSLTVTYETTVMWNGAEGPNREVLVAMAGRGLPEGAIHLEHEGRRVAIWRLPHDPVLPGLAVALDSARVRAVLDQIAAPAGPVTTRLRAYRPGRRAVVELNAGGTRLFAKLVASTSVAALQERHQLFAGAVNAPRGLGWSEPHGLILLEALQGTTLRTALGTAEAALPSPTEVLAVLEGLPAAPDGRRAPQPLRDAARHARLLRRLVPEAAHRIRALVESYAEDQSGGPLVPVHGDLYEDQVMVSGGRVSGILDIDTAGMGERADDLATFIGHLATWEAASPEPIRVREYARQLLAIADRLHDPASLRRRISAVVLGLATGPFRVQTPNWPAETLERITLAERWNDSADRIGAKRALASAAQ